TYATFDEGTIRQVEVDVNNETEVAYLFKQKLPRLVAPRQPGVRSPTKERKRENSASLARAGVKRAKQAGNSGINADDSDSSREGGDDEPTDGQKGKDKERPAGTPTPNGRGGSPFAPPGSPSHRALSLTQYGNDFPTEYGGGFDTSDLSPASSAPRAATAAPAKEKPKRVRGRKRGTAFFASSEGEDAEEDGRHTNLPARPAEKVPGATLVEQRVTGSSKLQDKRKHDWFGAKTKDAISKLLPKLEEDARHLLSQEERDRINVDPLQQRLDITLVGKKHTRTSSRVSPPLKQQKLDSASLFPRRAIGTAVLVPDTQVAPSTDYNGSSWPSAEHAESAGGQEVEHDEEENQMNNTPLFFAPSTSDPEGPVEVDVVTEPSFDEEELNDDDVAGEVFDYSACSDPEEEALRQQILARCEGLNGPDAEELNRMAEYEEEEHAGEAECAAVQAAVRYQAAEYGAKLDDEASVASGTRQQQQRGGRPAKQEEQNRRVESPKPPPQARPSKKLVRAASKPPSPAKSSAANERPAAVLNPSKAMSRAARAASPQKASRQQPGTSQRTAFQGTSSTSALPKPSQLKAFRPGLGLAFLGGSASSSSSSKQPGGAGGSSGPAARRMASASAGSSSSSTAATLARLSSSTPAFYGSSGKGGYKHRDSANGWM
ncbi:hypothetical protein JCM10213_007763, partial [Rhodosporidiobolus nylandii]